MREEKKYSADATQTTPLGQASRQAIQNAVVAILFGMPKVRWSGRVIGVRNGVVYVNAAAADGMRPGLELEVFEAQPALIDPETGKSLGAPESLVGTIVIETVLEKFSTAKIVDGTAVAAGNVLRHKGGEDGAEIAAPRAQSRDANSCRNAGSLRSGANTGSQWI